MNTLRRDSLRIGIYSLMMPVSEETPKLKRKDLVILVPMTVNAVVCLGSGKRILCVLTQSSSAGRDTTAAAFIS